MFSHRGNQKRRYVIAKMQQPERIKLVDLNPHLTCIICGGYFIDATTIIECLHSFCRTCIVKHLELNKVCPVCEGQVHKTRPLLNIRSDQTLQDIVYKLVPGLFKNEMKRRREFYSQASDTVKASIPVSSEERGDIRSVERLIFTPEDKISLSLEYCPKEIIPVRPLLGQTETNNQQQTFRRYLCCPGAFTVSHLKKFLRAKYGLSKNHGVDIMYLHDQLLDEYTMMDLAYIYSWKRNGPLRLFFKFAEPSVKKLKLDYEESIIISSSISDPQSVISDSSTKSDQSAPKENNCKQPPASSASVSTNVTTVSTTSVTTFVKTCGTATTSTASITTTTSCVAPVVTTTIATTASLFLAAASVSSQPAAPQARPSTPLPPLPKSVPPPSLPPTPPVSVNGTVLSNGSLTFMEHCHKHLPPPVTQHKCIHKRNNLITNNSNTQLALSQLLPVSRPPVPAVKSMFNGAFTCPHHHHLHKLPIPRNPSPGKGIRQESIARQRKEAATS